MSLELRANVRQQTGKAGNRRLRKQGNIPAVLYGPFGSMLLEVEEKSAHRLLEELPGTHKLVTLKVEDSQTGQVNEHSVLVQEIQVHPYRSELIHLDFKEVAMDKPVTLRIPLKAVGDAPGFKAGGILSMIVRDVPVSCLPVNIPEYVEADISKLELNTSLWMKELSYPPEVKPKSRKNIVVASVIGRTKQE